ncbi:glycosyltransferase family 61 protein|uniref:glycosyltransferase family 61 protein n=1 Tax=Pseudomonas TaxID=286 RepID=UPI0015D0E7B7|nr:glycosyltransferase family 61 protein [Pseudomonas sp. SbOxS1]NYU05025.1 glycosyltransferase family 61 protein [Pseudomonas sp. SbOxS1]
MMLTGINVSLKTAAENSGGTWHPVDLQHESYDWIKRERKHVEFGVAELNNVIVNHASQIFLPQHDMCVLDEGYVNALKWFPMPHSMEGDRFTATIDKPITEITAPTVLVGGQNNHWHMLMNWLPRIMLFEKVFGTASRYWIAMHSRPHPSQMDFLRLLKINTDKSMVYNEPNYGITKTFHFFKKLYVPTFFSNHTLNPAVINWWRDEIAEKLNRTGPQLYSGGIYASRQNEKRVRRRIRNSSELESALAVKGIQPIYCDDLSLQGQARAFSEAPVIVGAHGAQLANLVFAKPGTKVILFEYKDISEYEALCDMAGLECHKIITPQVEGTPEFGGNATEERLRDFEVNMSDVNGVLSKIYG